MLTSSIFKTLINYLLNREVCVDIFTFSCLSDSLKSFLATESVHIHTFLILFLILMLTCLELKAISVLKSVNQAAFIMVNAFIYYYVLNIEDREPHSKDTKIKLLSISLSIMFHHCSTLPCFITLQQL